MRVRWGDLAERLAQIPADTAPTPRRQEDVLGEILTAMRQQAENSSDIIRSLRNVHEEVRESRPFRFSDLASNSFVISGSPGSGKTGLQSLLTGQLLGASEPAPSDSTSPLGSPPEIGDAASGADIGEPPEAKH